MATLEAPTGQVAYPLVVAHVLKHSTERSPRGRATLDAGFTVIELETPYRALAHGTGRDLSRNIAVAEAIQLIGGFSSPELLHRASPNFRGYTEDDGTFHGAYGKRIGFQVLAVVEKLRRDPDTRQAVITLWDQWLDNLPDKRDYPCTVMLQFEIEDGRLVMNVVMRSNDAWLGLPYDIFQFTQLQISVANTLGVLCGTYRHTALSLHIYEENIYAATKLHSPDDSPSSVAEQPAGVGVFGHSSYSDVMKRARMLSARIEPPVETDSERCYRECFASYMG